MKKIFLAVFIAILGACSAFQGEDVYFSPDYNRIAANVNVVSKSPSYVVYEYKNIPIDELAPVAAQYCFDRGGRQASLYDITMHRNNARRATFVCRKKNGH